MMNRLSKLFNTLANMGIWIRFNDPRTQPPDQEGRVWGHPSNGFAVSLEAGSLDGLSILLKNTGTEDRRIVIPGWMSFYKFAVKTPFNKEAPMKSFGRDSISSAASTALVERAVPAGKSLSTDIPLEPLFDLRARGIWQIKVTCEIEGVQLISNELKIQRP